MEIVYELGVLLIGTSQGLRIGAIAANDTIEFGSVITTFGAVRSIAPLGDKVAIVGSEPPYLWRIDLSRFTSGTLVPAYAAESIDIVDANGPYAPGVDTTPLHVAVIPLDEDDQRSVGQRLVVMSAGTIWHYPGLDLEDTTDLAVEGSIDLGWFTYGIGEQLSLDSLVVECDPHDGVSTWSVTAHIDTPDADSVLTGTLDFSTSSTLQLFAANDIRAARFRVRLEVTGDATEGTGPEIRSVTLRAAPVPFMSDIMQLPLILTDSIRGEHNQTVGLDVFDEWSYLIGLRDSRQRVPIELGDYKATGRVESIEVAGGGLGAGNGLDGYDEKSQFVKGTWKVRLVTVEPDPDG
jgi:hypothetical protein